MSGASADVRHPPIYPYCGLLPHRDRPGHGVHTEEVTGQCQPTADTHKLALLTGAERERRTGLKSHRAGHLGSPRAHSVLCPGSPEGSQGVDGRVLKTRNSGKCVGHLGEDRVQRVGPADQIAAQLHVTERMRECAVCIWCEGGCVEGHTPLCECVRVRVCWGGKGGDKGQTQGTCRSRLCPGHSAVCPWWCSQACTCLQLNPCPGPSEGSALPH